LVLAVLANELTCAEAARRCGVTAVTVTKWKHQFLAAGAQRLEEIPAARRAGRHSRTHQALADRTPKQAYLNDKNQPKNLPTS
jgi:transposase